MVGLEPGDAPEVAEQLPSRHKLHDEVEVSGILAKPLEVNLRPETSTMNG